MRRDALPQTVGFATSDGWEWLRFRCLKCRHEGTISLMRLRSTERLESIAARVRCTKCRRRTETSCRIGGDGRVIDVQFEGALIGPVEHHG